MRLAPICLFVYNRLSETQQTIKALQENFLSKESHLIIYSDGFKNLTDEESVINIRSFLKEISGFKSIIIRESDINKGLAQSIIDGVTEVLTFHESIIVLEDDLITTPNFLDFMNQALTYFRDKSEIYSINGYSPDIGEVKSDVFIHSRSFPWGWGTWRDRWEQDSFEEIAIKRIITPNLLSQFSLDCGGDAKKMLLDSLNGKNNSWYIKWVFNNYCNKKYAVFPMYSKVMNIGFTSFNSTHCKEISCYEQKLDTYNSTDFSFNNIYSIQRHDSRFIKYFSKKHKLKFRLRLVFKKGGFLLLLNELKNRLL